MVVSIIWDLHGMGRDGMQSEAKGGKEQVRVGGDIELRKGGRNESTVHIEI